MGSPSSTRPCSGVPAAPQRESPVHRPRSLEGKPAHPRDRDRGDCYARDMIEQTIENWHKCIRGELEGGLDAILHDDCVFYSPVVFTPQRGKELTKMYLNAAGATFGDGEPSTEPSLSSASSSGDEKGFRYVKEVLSGHHAILEFETEMGGKYVNGIDMITCDDEGKITEFKVMIRPLQAVNLLHQKMAAMLEQMKS